MPERLDPTKTGHAIGVALVTIITGVWSWWRKKGRRKRELLKHPFFSHARDVQRWARKLPIPDRMRQEAFQDLVGIKLAIWPRELEKLVRELDIAKLDADGLKRVLHLSIDSIVDDYGRIARERGIPALVVAKFNKWHSSAVDSAHAFIDSICDSDWRDTTDMMAAMLSWMLAALDQTIIDAEETLADINGEMDGLTYKGWVAGSYESPKRLRRKARESESGKYEVFKP